MMWKVVLLLACVVGTSIASCVGSTVEVAAESTTLSPTTTESPTTVSGSSDGEANDNGLDNLEAGITEFNGEFLYERMKESEGENIIASPFSVFTPLAQLALYANGDSSKQLNSVLNVSSKQEIRSAFPALTATFDGQTSVNFSLAAKIYSDLQAPLSDDFKRDSVIVANAEAQELDFSKNTDAANTINAWVESKTNNRIKNLIAPTDLSPSTRLVLVNAIYFKGAWANPFNKANTNDADFYLTDGTTKTTKMMYQTKNFNYVDLPDFDSTAIEMLYQGRNFSMVAVLPNKKDGILKLAENLQVKENFNRILENMKSQRVKVYLPSFEINTSTDLTAILKEEGVTKIFDPQDSGLRGILKTPEDTHVSKAIQKAFIKVDESGSEAAAANAVVVGVTSAVIGPVQEVEFRCDHSFLYYITFRGRVIFSGAFVNPN